MQTAEIDGLIARVGAELERIAGCGDIPAYRRRQLLHLAEQLRPPPARTPGEPVEMVLDPHYFRPGARLRKYREATVETSAGPVLFLKGSGARE